MKKNVLVLGAAGMAGHVISLHLREKGYEVATLSNRNKLDNRKENLRTCSDQENMCNRTKQSNNTSGYKGVSWDKKLCKWLAKITYKRKQIYLGIFNDIKIGRAHV